MMTDQFTKEERELAKWLKHVSFGFVKKLLIERVKTSDERDLLINEMWLLTARELLQSKWVQK